MGPSIKRLVGLFAAKQLIRKFDLKVTIEALGKPSVIAVAVLTHLLKWAGVNITYPSF